MVLQVVAQPGETETAMANHERTIEVLVSPGCAGRANTAALVADVVSELAIEARIVELVVDDVDQARALKFLGSPSIRVDGRDIAAEEDEPDDFGLG